MSKKVIDLFSGLNSRESGDEKYADLLNEFIKPFVKDFPKIMSMTDIIGFGANAWNLGCLSQEATEKDIDILLSMQQFSDQEHKVLKKMIQRKKKDFASHDRMIQDYLLEEKNGDRLLTVYTEDKEEYVNNLMEDATDFLSDESDYDGNCEEGYIDRHAIVIKPLDPFFNWLNALDPENPVNEVDESNVYLIDDHIDEVEKWLKKNFDRFFQIELSDWITDDSKWPMRRTYKMFRQWFSVDISTMVYDMETRPINKGH